MIDRRTFIGSAAAFALTLPGRATAQPARKMPRVALVFGTAPVTEMAGPDPTSPLARAFVHGMRDLGWVDGRNIVLERRSAEGRLERLPDVMRELVALGVDVIATAGPGVVPALAATDRIPIVTLNSASAQAIGGSLARPQRNLTGLLSEEGPSIDAKRLQLLKECVPKASRIAYMRSRAGPGAPPWSPDFEVAARSLGLTLARVNVDRAEEISEVFAAMDRDRTDALYVSNSHTTYTYHGLIAALALKHRLPTVYELREPVDTGGLMSYGPNRAAQLRRAAAFVDKILKGAKPGDLPFEQPTKFELVVNLKTAKAIGLSVPQALLLQADELIQ